MHAISSHRHWRLLTKISTSLLFMTGVNSFAQEMVLEEIVITAQKRSESLQDVPISVAVTRGEKIEEANITTLEELSLSVPNLFIADNPLGSSIYIRGIGSQHNQGIEQSVAIFADGIYRGRTQQNRAPFLDVGRIEVLRGPQSILFGKNTIGGAINVVSAQPTDIFESSLSLLVGTDSEQEAQFIASGPLSDSIKARLALRDYHKDGFIKNVTLDRDDPKIDESVARIILQWDPTDNLQTTLRYEHNEFDAIGLPTQDTSLFPFDDEREVANAGGQLLLASGAITQVFLDDTSLFVIEGESSNTTIDEAALRIDYLWGDITVTSITGWTTFVTHQKTDGDISPLPTIGVDAREDFEQFSQEIRFVSPKNQTLDWITGLYFQDSSIDFFEADYLGTRLLAGDLIPENFQAILNPDIIENAFQHIDFEQDATTAAAFAQVTWHIASQLRSTLGLRYTYEKKEAFQDLGSRNIGDAEDVDCVNPPALTTALADPSQLPRAVQCQLLIGYLTNDIAALPIPGASDLAKSLLNLGSYAHTYEDERSEAQWTPSVNIQYDIDDKKMVYFSITKGFKGGGYDARILLDQERADPFGVGFEFDSEKVLSFEAGGKMAFSGLAELNVALFRAKLKDLQVSMFDGRTGFVVGNVAEVLTQGVEIDGRALLSQNLTIAAAVAWLDASYADFKNGGCTAQQFTEWEEATGSRNGCANDLTDHRTLLSPEWTASLRTIFHLPLSESLLLSATLDINFRDNYDLDADGDKGLIQTSYVLYNAGLGISAIDRKWSLSLIGKNLSDEIYAYNGADIPLTEGNFVRHTAALRSYALQGQIRF